MPFSPHRIYHSIRIGYFLAVMEQPNRVRRWTPRRRRIPTLTSSSRTCSRCSCARPGPTNPKSNSRWCCTVSTPCSRSAIYRSRNSTGPFRVPILKYHRLVYLSVERGERSQLIEFRPTGWDYVPKRCARRRWPAPIGTWKRLRRRCWTSEVDSTKHHLWCNRFIKTLTNLSQSLSLSLPLWRGHFVHFVTTQRQSSLTHRNLDSTSISCRQIKRSIRFFV